MQPHKLEPHRRGFRKRRETEQRSTEPQNNSAVNSGSHPKKQSSKNVITQAFAEYESVYGKEENSNRVVFISLLFLQQTFTECPFDILYNSVIISFASDKTSVWNNDPRLGFKISPLFFQLLECKEKQGLIIWTPNQCDLNSICSCDSKCNLSIAMPDLSNSSVTPNINTPVSSSISISSPATVHFKTRDFSRLLPRHVSRSPMSPITPITPLSPITPITPNTGVHMRMPMHMPPITPVSPITPLPPILPSLSTLPTIPTSSSDDNRTPIIHNSNCALRKFLNSTVHWKWRIISDRLTQIGFKSLNLDYNYWYNTDNSQLLYCFSNKQVLNEIAFAPFKFRAIMDILVCGSDDPKLSLIPMVRWSQLQYFRSIDSITKSHKSVGKPNQKQSEYIVTAAIYSKDSSHNRPSQSSPIEESKQECHCYKCNRKKSIGSSQSQPKKRPLFQAKEVRDKNGFTYLSYSDSD